MEDLEKLILHRYPNGATEWLYPSDLCKCKKYRKIKGVDYCLRCEPTRPSQQKKSNPKKK